MANEILDGADVVGQLFGERQGHMAMTRCTYQLRNLRQLALYQERHVKPRRTTHTLRMVLVWLAAGASNREHLVRHRQEVGLIVQVQFRK